MYRIAQNNVIPEAKSKRAWVGVGWGLSVREMRVKAVNGLFLQNSLFIRQTVEKLGVFLHLEYFKCWYWLELSNTIRTSLRTSNYII